MKKLEFAIAAIAIGHQVLPLWLCKLLDSFFALKFEQVSSSQRNMGDFLLSPIISF